MKLLELAWPDVESIDREIVVLIPTGSLEQHGHHLPLFTDTILATSVAEAVERAIPDKVLLTPTLWLGASSHHLKFPGTLSASFETYIGAIKDIVDSLVPHGFRKFFVLNGHGGNNDPNGMALRGLKARHDTCIFGHAGYYAYAEAIIADVLQGPLKGMRHACEAETSLMLHLRPDLVRTDRLRNDGLTAEPSIRGLVQHFDEVTEQGSFGYATLASSDTGKRLFDAVVEAVTLEMGRLAEGYVLRGLESRVK